MLVVSVGFVLDFLIFLVFVFLVLVCLMLLMPVCVMLMVFDLVSALLVLVCRLGGLTLEATKR